MGFPNGSEGKESAFNEEIPGSIPWLGISPGEGNGYPLQYSCMENSVDRGASRAKSKGSQRVGHDWNDFTHMHSHMHEWIEVIMHWSKPIELLKSNPTTGHIPWQNHHSKRHMYPNVHYSTIYNIYKHCKYLQFTATNLFPSTEKIVYVVHIHSGILLSLKKGMNLSQLNWNGWT